MEHFMMRWSLAGWWCALIMLWPAVGAAQTDESRKWIVVGAASATVRGDCQTCEEDFPYRHGLGILGNAGYRINPRMDVGAEIFWVPLETASGTLNTTHIDAVAQFRPWRTQGFFFKGGAGMAFIRNWVDAIGPGAINSKALSVVIGTGWVFRADKRVGLELFASQHAGALGDLQTAAGEVPDVLGNYWSIGAALVFR
jgi:hypothetical protein